MSDVDSLKTGLKRLDARATQAKMNLHDLSEELPVNRERIPEVARVANEAHEAHEAQEAHVALMAARKRLAEMAP